MKDGTLSFKVFAAATLLGIPSAFAATIVDKSPGTTGGTHSFTASNASSGQNFLTGFALNTATSLTAFSIFVDPSYANVPSVTVKIRSDAGGSPALVDLFRFTDSYTVDSVDTGSSDAVRVTATFSPILLSAGTYYFGLSGTNSELTWDFFTGGTNVGGTQYQLTNDTIQFAFSSKPLDYQIFGTTMSTVPLPASAPMFGAGLIALGVAGVAAKRRKSAEA